MMNNRRTYQTRHTRGQGLVEFALILPVLLAVVFGIIEFARLVFTYVSTMSASREAARYASAVGGNLTGLPRYRDCDGIRAAARRVGLLAGLADTDIVIKYDHGPETAVFEDCPIGWNPVDDFAYIDLGDRVVVQVTGHFTPIVPFIPTNVTTVESISARSIVRDVVVGTAYVPVPPPPPPGPKVSFVYGSSSESEGVPYRTIEVILSEPPTANVSVPVNIAGTATAGGVDYDVITALPLVFAPGQTSVVIQLAITDDNIYELPEEVVLTLGPPSGGNASLSLENPTTHRANIEDNDPQPLVFFNPGALSAPEEGILVPNVFIQMDRPAAVDVVVNAGPVGGTALLNVDYNLITTFPITISAGMTAYPVVVEVLTDPIYEDTEVATLKILSVLNAQTGSPDAFNLSIVNTTEPPVVAFEMDRQSGTEQTGVEPARITLSRLSSIPVTISYAREGTAEYRVDYTLTPQDKVTIPPMTTNSAINIAVLDDGQDTEPDETITLRMTSVTNAVMGQPDVHTATIVNRTVRFTAATQPSTNEENPASLQVQVVLNRAHDEEIRVPLITGGTATAGVDYTITSPSGNEVVFPAGTTSRTINLQIINDAVYEGEETIFLTLGQPTNAARVTPFQHTIRIFEADKAPGVSFRVATQEGSEEQGSMTVYVDLSAVSGLPVSVPYAVSGTASQGASLDYTIAPQPVVIAPGMTSASIVITVNEDAHNEDNETVILNMGTPTNAARGRITNHTATILDNDSIPVVTFTIANQTVDESLFRVTVGIQMNAASGRMVTIPFSVGGSASPGTDFTVSPSNQVVYIAAGNTQASITIDITNDTLPEAEEEILLTMGDIVNALPGTITVHRVNITDNDASRCNAVYSIGNVSVSELQSGNNAVSGYKITTSIYNGGSENVTLTGVRLSYRVQVQNGNPSVVISEIRTTNQIWPADTRTANSGVWITDGWRLGGDRTLPSFRYTPLVFLLDILGDGKIRTFEYLTLTLSLSNGCVVSP